MATNPEEAVRRYLLHLEDPSKLVDEAKVAVAQAAVEQAKDPLERLKALARLEHARQPDTQRRRAGLRRQRQGLRRQRVDPAVRVPGDGCAHRRAGPGRVPGAGRSPSRHHRHRRTPPAGPSGLARRDQGRGGPAPPPVHPQRPGREGRRWFAGHAPQGGRRPRGRGQGAQGRPDAELPRVAVGHPSSTNRAELGAPRRAHRRAVTNLRGGGRGRGRAGGRA